MFSDKQLDFLANSTHDFNLLEGAVSSGKTFIGNIRWHDYILYDAPPNSLLVMTGRTLGSLYDNCIREMEQYDTTNDFNFIKIKEGIVVRIEFKRKGISIACAGADNQSSWKSVQGKTIAGWYGDEITNQPKSLVLSLQKGCRFEGRSHPIFWTTNPDKPSHYIRMDYMTNPNIDIKIWSFLMDDNPKLTTEYKNRMKATYKGIDYDRFILGKWTASTDTAVYFNFNRHTNLVDEPLNNYPDAPTLTMFDFGLSDSMAIITWQEIKDPNAPNGLWINIIDEIQDRNKFAPEYAKMMRRKEWFNNVNKRYTGDPFDGKTRGSTPSSWQSEFKKEKINIELPQRAKPKDMITNAVQYIESIRINERQCPKVVEMFENWCYPENEDGMPKDDSLPVHDNYSHLGTSIYYGFTYRFPIRKGFQITQG